MVVLAWKVTNCYDSLFVLLVLYSWVIKRIIQNLKLFILLYILACDAYQYHRILKKSEFAPISNKLTVLSSIIFTKMFGENRWGPCFFLLTYIKFLFNISHFSWLLTWLFIFLFFRTEMQTTINQKLMDALISPPGIGTTCMADADQK